VKHYAHSVAPRLGAGIETGATQEWQPLAEHLRAVADLAGERGAKFGAGKSAAFAGLMHDLGKYSAAFQRKLEGSGERVDHSTAGAQEVVRFATDPDSKVIAQVIAHAIAGHHAGLPDTIGDETSLNALLRREVDPLDPAWLSEISPVAFDLMPTTDWGDKSSVAYRLAFFGRMIFSCLVDADFRDTEAFYCAADRRAVDREWLRLPDIADALISRFDAHMAKTMGAAKATPVNTLRAEILRHVRGRADQGQGLFTLTVPPGGGKTLASLGFALDHAKRHNLDRIVYAIPFTSIIDQTALIFRDVLGDGVVLEHHASIDESRIEGREARAKLRLAMEDWAAPVVVTTNVQLFESLHSNRPSRCRRLHSLARSVIILDEAQTIPLHVLRPCLAAIDELARNYGATIILCTATQPAVGAPQFEGGLALGQERELAPDPVRLHRELKRVRVTHIGDQTDADLVEALSAVPQGLVIVNSRAHALMLYRAAVAAGLDSMVHLSTRQYAAHRRRVLADVRHRLREGKPCRVVATSLVEAGVDLDFPAVWRAEAGLDQIAQAAGRCNREGVRPIEESFVRVFRSTEHRPPHEIAALAGDMTRAARKHDDILSPAAIQGYFAEIYWRKGAAVDRENILGAYAVSGGAPSFEYQRIGDTFRMIEDGFVPVIITREAKAQAALAALWAGAPPGSVARRLQPFLVQVPPQAREALLAKGHVRFADGEFAVLVTESLYRDDVGLEWEDVG
jgi:CRISPR-associated endonuclease/helicase Cas3